MKSILGIFLSTLLGFSLGNYKCRQLIKPTSTTAEMFPYHAVIRSFPLEKSSTTKWCNGAIISENFVLTRGTCVLDRKDVTVYLGFSRNPYHSKNRQDPNGQIFQSEQVYMHEEFGYIEKNHQYLNNLALIKLHKNIEITATVKPITIASPDDFPIPPGTFINQTGFENLQVDDYLRYATVQQNYYKMCNVFYGNSLLPVQETCVRQEGVDRNRWVGPYVVDGVLIGFHRSVGANTFCQVTTPPCDNQDVYITLEPALLWIYKASGISADNCRGHFQSSCNPYWDREKNMSTILTQRQSNQKDSDMLDDIYEGIREGLKPSLCKK